MHLFQPMFSIKFQPAVRGKSNKTFYFNFDFDFSEF